MTILCNGNKIVTRVTHAPPMHPAVVRCLTPDTEPTAATLRKTDSLAAVEEAHYLSLKQGCQVGSVWMGVKV
jgi:hypothetical protein